MKNWEKKTYKNLEERNIIYKKCKNVPMKLAFN